MGRYESSRKAPSSGDGMAAQSHTGPGPPVHGWRREETLLTPRIMLAHLFTAGGVKRRCMAAQFWRTRSPARAEGEGLFNTSSSVGACLYHTALCGCASAAASAAAGSSTGGARGLPSAPRRRSLRTDGQRCRKSTGKRMDQERCVWQSTGLCGDAR